MAGPPGFEPGTCGSPPRRPEAAALSILGHGPKRGWRRGRDSNPGAPEGQLVSCKRDLEPAAFGRLWKSGLGPLGHPGSPCMLKNFVLIFYGRYSSSFTINLWICEIVFSSDPRSFSACSLYSFLERIPRLKFLSTRSILLRMFLA